MRSEFKVPKRGTAVHKVIELLRKVDSLTRKQAVEAMEAQGMRKEATIHALEHMRDMGWANLEDCKYSISSALRRYYDMREKANKYCGEIAPPRTASEFCEIQPKNQFWNAYRREPIRTDVSFKNGSTGFNNIVGYRA